MRCERTFTEHVFARAAHRESGPGVQRVTGMAAASKRGLLARDLAAGLKSNRRGPRSSSVSRRSCRGSAPLPHEPGRRRAQPQLHQPLCLEAGAQGRRSCDDEGAGDARGPTLLRECAARSRDQHPRAGGVPRPQRPRLDPADLHAPHAAVARQGEAGRQRRLREARKRRQRPAVWPKCGPLTCEAAGQGRSD
jgi:hypothetical protein